MIGPYKLLEEDMCPYCGYMCIAEFCDVGVGMKQIGPYSCEFCGAVEIGAFDCSCTNENVLSLGLHELTCKLSVFNDIKYRNTLDYYPPDPTMVLIVS